MSPIELSVVVVSWKAGEDVGEIAREFPRDPRFELIVVDNSGEVERELVDGDRIRLLSPGRNLGFAAGSNAGARAARGARLLFLNPDARAVDQAFERILAAFREYPEASGCVPRLVGFDGAPQHTWQLKPLPGPGSLLAHALFWNPVRGPRLEPAAGTPVAQPAAAALALTRGAFEAVGGFDEAFHPAWFEDVDLARRLDAHGRRIVYTPSAVFLHRGGASVGDLGYAGFLLAYDRNLARYLRIHHGRAWELLFRALVPIGALARIAVLPLRRPRRAASRRAAAAALWRVARGARTGWPPEEAAR